MVNLILFFINIYIVLMKNITKKFEGNRRQY